MSEWLTASGRCRDCGKAQFRVATDGMGRAFDVPSPCSCILAKRAVVPKPKVRREWVKSVNRERRLACVCQLCDEPTVGKPRVALYCEAHRVEQSRRAQARFRAKLGPEYWRDTSRRYVLRNREQVRRQAKQRARRASVRARNAEYKRLWRKANRDKVRASKQRAGIRNFRNPQPGVKRWRAEVKAGLRKPKPARRTQHGERLCCNGLCRQVVQGHARMCERCKARLAREAAAQLRAA